MIDNSLNPEKFFLNQIEDEVILFKSNNLSLILNCENNLLTLNELKTIKKYY